MTHAKPPWPYWSLSVEDLIHELASGPDGLTSAAAEDQLRRHGPNMLRPPRRSSGMSLFIGQFRSPIILILLFATAMSAILRDWLDAVIILLIVLGSALLSFYQEYRATTAVARLQARAAAMATVLRGGRSLTIPAEAVVPGDIILLSAGSLVPADCVILDANDLFVNQAVLTGETFPVEKRPGPSPVSSSLSERTNLVFMGTNVRSGSGRALVVETGSRTAFGQIADRLELRPPETEFERGIRRLGQLLTEVMLLLVLGIFAVNVFFHRSVIDSLLFSVALAVGLTPQLLPAIINVNLSRGAQVMGQKGVIVRRLASIENFGSMDVLCTDKTGTLTEGTVSVDGVYDAWGETSGEVMRWAYHNARHQTGLANALDDAILARGDGKDDPIGPFVKIDEVPYDFVRRRLSVVVQDSRGNRILIAKGALDGILAGCVRVVEAGKEVSLTPDRLEEIHRRFATWSLQGLRVLGIATKEVADKATYARADEVDMCFAGFLTFLDPPKPDVLETVRDLAKLGVTLKIITGDNRLVTQSIARTIGLPPGDIVTGAELDEMRDEALWQVADRAELFAEVDPNQKERIILALQKRGHVVGYLGDGINDAPALHAADVGISVEQAVDIAKESADLVLLQHDLAVLREGILQGRKTFANTLKYVFMATSANFGNMFSVAAASLLLPFLPLLPKQILLINFLTDLPEMAIASDRVDAASLEKPQRWDVGFIRRFMLVFGSLSSFFDIITFGILLLLIRTDPERFRTGWFVESVLSATLVVFVLRTRKSVMRSQPSRAMLGMAVAVVLATVLVPLSPIAGPMGFRSPSPAVALLVLGVVLVYLVAAEGTKRWFFHRLEIGEGHRASSAPSVGG